ncbi:MAG TPA: hypothetical protein VHV09_15155 [Trebonia sp.]|nr:hypothetical protein [Trebonia sp.]
MPVVMVIAILVVFAVVVFAAAGRGAGLSAERGDFVPLDLGPVSATDVVLLRPPTGLWGYNMQATDEAMEQIAASIRERDVRIVALEQLVTDLSRDQAPSMPLASPYAGARHRRTSADLYREQTASGAGTAESDYREPAYAEPAYAESAYAEPAYAEPAYPETEQPETEQPGTEYPGTEYPATEKAGTEYPGTEPVAAGYAAGKYPRTGYQDAGYPESAGYPAEEAAEPGADEDSPSEAGAAAPPEQSHD